MKQTCLCLSCEEQQTQTSFISISINFISRHFIFAYKTTTGSAPLYLNSLLQTYVPSSLLQTYVPSKSLHSASEQRIIVPSQRGTKSLSQTFSLVVPSWWNDPPNSIRAAESLAIFKKRLKTHLSHLYLTL